MANTPIGQLPREPNPLNHEKAGFTSSWKDADGRYPETGIENPLPVQITNTQAIQEVKDPAVRAALESLQLQMAELANKTKNSHVGYAATTKPAGKNGDSFLELDTGKVFMHDGTKWGEL